MATGHDPGPPVPTRGTDAARVLLTPRTGLLAVGLLARLGLAAVWLVSGAVKAVDPLQTVVAVRAYQLLPEAAVVPVASLLPFLEIALGLLLVAGVGVRPTAVVSAVVLVAFILGVASAWARGLSIDCGCFGGGGAADVGPLDYAGEIGRDLLFLAGAGWLVVRPRTPLALGPRSSEPLTTPTDPPADHPAGTTAADPTLERS